MVNFNAYLQSISDTYGKWSECYTITDVVGKQRDEPKRQLPFFDFGLMVEKIKQQQEEETERLTVLNGLRKYSHDHVLLIGRPGSGKSTALIRLLLETAENQNHLEINFQANSESRLKTTKSEDLAWWFKQNFKIALKILDLVTAVMENPFEGIGKPEPLKYIDADIWFRRIDLEHRLVYRVRNTQIDFLACRYHYE